MNNCLKHYTAAKFNAQYHVGSHFRYFPVMGIPDAVEVVTRSTAWELENGQVVVRVSGRSGGVAVRHLSPVSGAAVMAAKVKDILHLEALTRMWPEDHLIHQLALRLLWWERRANQ